MIKENDVEIAFSGIIHSEDLRDSKEMIDDTNKKLKNYCASLGIGFINNANIDGFCFSRCKSYLNRKGTCLFNQHILSYEKLKTSLHLDHGVMV